MTSKKVLVTGGAGFIGSHLVDNLLTKGHEVIVFDNLNPQVHGNITTPPDYLSKDITFIRGDVCDRDILAEAIKDVEVVYHLAAAVGLAQSMYQIEHFTLTNSGGTATLLDVLVNDENQVKKLVVASSMCIYGEGEGMCSSCGRVSPKLRYSAPKAGESWDLKCPSCNQIVSPIPTREEKELDCSTVYALTKKEQEQLCLLVGKTYGLDTTAMRFFGTYGSRQALSNPYTGVAAIFSTSYLAGNSPTIYEDGLQTRDLVHVKDICQGLMLAMERPEARNESFNIGTGNAVSINHVADVLRRELNPEVHPIITSKFRAGDVRHISADITKIQEKLGYSPKYSFDEGISELLPWIKAQNAVQDNSKIANEELRQKGLL